jgi:hypothetical protein
MSEKLNKKVPINFISANNNSVDNSEEQEHKPARKNLIIIILACLVCLVVIISFLLYFLFLKNVFSGFWVKQQAPEQAVSDYKESLPDISIKNVGFGANNNEFAVLIENIGKGDFASQNFGLLWHFLDGQGNPIGQFEKQITEIILTSGQKISVVLSGIKVEPGAEFLFIFVDPYNSYDVSTGKLSGKSGANEKTILNNSFVFSLNGLNLNSQSSSAEDSANKNTAQPIQQPATPASGSGNQAGSESQQSINQKDSSGTQNNATASTAGSSASGTSSKTSSSGNTANSGFISNFINLAEQANEQAIIQQVSNSNSTSDSSAGSLPSSPNTNNSQDVSEQNKTQDSGSANGIQPNFNLNLNNPNINLNVINSNIDSSLNQPAIQPAACYWEDTDSGKEKTVKGTCRSNIPGLNIQKAVDDYCKDSTTVVEFYVNDSCTTCSSEEISCAPAGYCSNGECVKPGVCYWTDTDRGYNINQNGSCGTNIPNSVNKSMVEYCKDSRVLVEYNVNDTCTGCDVTEVRCIGSCYNGACVESTR